MNLDFTKVCGKHSAIYEAYYKQIDPKGSGAIEAMVAAKVLKKSGLSDVVLSRVWDLSDPNGKGYLDKPGFFVSLKLVSLAQAGHVVNMSNIYVEMANPPKLGDYLKSMPPRVQTVPVSTGYVANGDWSINVIDKHKYEQLFESLKPQGGMLPGNKVKGVLMDSKLPMETLGKIWDLADQDKDGNLDKYEFIVAMHLVYQTLEKRTIPDVLPPELRKTTNSVASLPKPSPPVVGTTVPRAPSGEGFGDGGFVANFPKDITPTIAAPHLPVSVSQLTRMPSLGAGEQPLISTEPLVPIGSAPSVNATADWVVTSADLKRFERNFRESDHDKHGLVSGLEVKNVFLQSGVPQNCLAHIWALCDTNQSGKLTLEQFSLAMWMVERKQNGIEPPQVLTANMVPPTMRATVNAAELQHQIEPKETYSNPELEMISKEIEELCRERRMLESEISQKEADIRIKSGEVRSLQSEWDTLSATLKQLENQRGEAQKRLDDLKSQVTKIREQCHKQEETISNQEGELNTKRSELQKLKDEEASLQKEYDKNNIELLKLTEHLQNTQLQISSIRSMITQLMETQRQMTDALLLCRAAFENQNAELVSEYQLKIEVDFDEACKTLEKKIDDSNSDPTASNNTNGFTTINRFGDDPFGVASNVGNNFRAGFDYSFNKISGFNSVLEGFGNDNAFSELNDSFGGDVFGVTKAVTTEPSKDDFGSDPFAALHAPTGQGQVLSPNMQKCGPPPRPESPSPALPPKKSKVPPPRPAPPRPLQGPAHSTDLNDGFGTISNSTGFADFADFDNKLSTTQSTHSLLLAELHSTTPFMCNSSSSSNNTMTSAKASIPVAPTTLLSTPFTSISSTRNNNLPYSLKLQEQASYEYTSSPKTDSCTTINGPIDFSDDPFKDCRYEDPFSIKDPFVDDSINGSENTLNDNLNIETADDDKKDLNYDGPTKLSFFSHSCNTTELLQTQLNSNFKSLNVNINNNNSSNKSNRNTPAQLDSIEFLNNFADFDLFSGNSSTVDSKFEKSIDSDSLYDALNENLIHRSNSAVNSKHSEI